MELVMSAAMGQARDYPHTSHTPVGIPIPTNLHGSVTWPALARHSNEERVVIPEESKPERVQTDQSLLNERKDADAAVIENRLAE